MSYKMIGLALLLLSACTSNKVESPEITSDSLSVSRPDSVVTGSDSASTLDKQTQQTEEKVNDLLKGI